MAINGIQPVGDDQRWKQEVEEELRELRKLLSALLTQNSRTTR